MAKKKVGLGRGLDALLGGQVFQKDSSENSNENMAAYDAKEDVFDASKIKAVSYIEEDDHVEIKGENSRVRKVGEITEAKLSDICPNPDQPRTSFKKEEIDELADSIERDGLLQPILVREFEGKYQIVAGERRYQACKKLKLETVPIRVREVEDDKVIELAMVENLQRSDLNPIEEAYGYKRMMERRGMTQTDVAQAVSKGRSTVANALRLLDLPEEAQQLLYEDKITAGHARAILSVQSEEGRTNLTNKLKNEKISVREAEAIAHLLNGREKAAEARVSATPVPAYYKKATKALKEQLGMNVRIKTSKGKSRLEIEFKDEEELRKLFKTMMNEDFTE